MRVLAVAGSPRRKGNTDALLEQAIAGAESVGAEVDHVILSRLNVGPCIECNRCFETGRCAVQDDFQELYDKILESDAIMLASPIFFMHLDAQTKAFIDRFQCLWARQQVLKEPLPPPASGGKRRALFLSTAGWAKTKFDCALLTVRAALTTVRAKLVGQLCVNAMDDKGEVAQHPDILKQAYDLGVQLASADQTGGQA
jgi:multimeric flavodoxin WrbA